MAAMAAAAAMSSTSVSSTLLSVAAGSPSPTSSSIKPALTLLRRTRAPAHGVTHHRRRARARAPSALFGGGEKGTGEKKPEKKFITREEEPEQYWKSEAEKDGKNPMQTLLPYIALLTLLSPFAILAVAYTQGWIKVPN